eukprot:TRINITY_DN19966_c0_g1_i1.p1 TRINITY_DN19966_c0_g1~~TRINITY_DN19966_c0_g1_i1.p1  ORF type:complete len:655 (-),score=86.17 TRINITY_DN19966_c0_g1_i1:47-2011(-)
MSQCLLFNYVCQTWCKVVARRLTWVFAMSACVRIGMSWQSFQDNIPNGKHVQRDGAFPGVGHLARNGAGPLNVFGRDFQSAGTQWTKDLCQKDSDKDGQSNGVELGDPACTWSVGAVPQRTTDISHPGFGDSQTSAAPKGNGTGIVEEHHEGRGSRMYIIILMLFLLVLLAVSVVVARLHTLMPKTSSESRLMSLIFWPRAEGWHVASMIGVGLVWLAHGVFLVLAAHPYSTTNVIKTSGRFACFSSLLPMLFAFSTFGLHRLLTLGREAAWIIHIALGDLFLVLSTIHGAFVLKAYGSKVFDKWQHVMGLLCVVIMWISVLPAFLHATVPKLMPYAGFKIVHWLALPAYLLGVIHVLSMEVSPTGIIMAIVIFAFVADKTVVKATGKVTVAKCQASQDFAFLQLQVERFAFAPGQWAHLLVKQISLVPHPFTLVPGDDMGTVQLMIAKSGTFTQGLVKAIEAREGGVPKMILEGPYGHPPLQGLACGAVVLVCGGIGITPAFSILPEAIRLRQDRVWLLWTLRKPELLTRCASLIEPHVGSAKVTVALSKGSLPAEELPYDVQQGSVDVNEWLQGVARDLASVGVSTAFLFVCGPSGLAKAAKVAASKCAAEVTWTVHVEQFHFVPDKSCKKAGLRSPSPNTVGPIQLGSKTE